MVAENKFMQSVKQFMLGSPVDEAVILHDTKTGNDNKREVKISQFSEAELRHIPGIRAPISGNLSNRPMATPDILKYLTNATTENRNIMQEMRHIAALSPEHKQASRIMVSSIISPNDMQVGQVGVLSKAPELGDDINALITEELNDFFNTKLKLGVRLARWLDTAMFTHGSAPVMLLPKWNLDNLNAAVDNDMMKCGMQYGSGSTLQNIGCSSWFDEVDSKLMSKLSISMEQFQAAKTVDNLDTSAIVMREDMLHQVKTLDIFGYTDVNNKEWSETDFDNIATESLSAAVKLITDNKSFILTHDQPMAVLQHRIKSFGDASKNVNDKINKYFVGDGAAPLMIVQAEGELDSKDHPAIIELPPESVVPVCVPGTPSEHIGYFVLIDQFGSPMTSRVMDQVSSFGSRRLVQSTVDAAYGKPVENIIGNRMDAAQRFAATSTIFGITLKNMMERKLDTLGFRGVQVEQHDAISNCMFHHLLQRKHVGLIFVPAELMCYFCVDHREDGTGKAITEDCRIISAMRTALLIADVMAAMRNSTDRRVIEMNIDDQNTNFEQACDLARKVFTEKQMLRFDNNPQTIARDLINKALVILPKGMKGIPDITPSQESRPTNSPRVDADLMKMLGDWMIAFIGIPPSALNALNEAEYSRSVATNNLFFSNNIRTYQAIIIYILTKFGRNYLKFAPALQRKLKDIVGSKATSTVAVEGHDDNTSIDGEKIDTERLIGSIIANLEITLPTPNIAAGKAQIEELSTFVDVVDRVLAKVVGDELVDANDSEGKAALAQIRSQMAGDIIRGFIAKIGLVGTLNIPALEDVKLNSLQQLVVLLNQTKAMIRSTKTSTERKDGSDSQPDGGGDNNTPPDGDGGAPIESAGASAGGDPGGPDYNDKGGKDTTLSTSETSTTSTVSKGENTSKTGDEGGSTDEPKSGGGEETSSEKSDTNSVKDLTNSDFEFK